MIDATLANFKQEVLEASKTVPVLLDFWAPGAGPGELLGPLLEQLEAAYAGSFKLVRVDAIREEKLSAAFGIQSVPTCILMVGGQPVDSFAGVLPESEIRAFLERHVAPAEESLALEAFDDTDPEAVLQRLQDAVTAAPANDNARFDYVKHLLLLGRDDDAKVAFAPVIAQTGSVRRFDSLKRWMDAIDFVATHADAESAEARFDEKIAANKRDFDARFDKARWLMAGQRWTDALDELLEILMRDKTWSDGLARKTYIAILDIMEAPKPKVADGQIPPEDATVATYRRRLSSVVLS
ncbi:tetratricopeptide repeat protein [Polaromonas naphthalenivorans]|uniref:Thioredoxin domain protein n=1 Tax=Polaromonas naphthalenivorans (strain CJ2) TaxID=365044 RepID=A1VU32_POLNA|nr:tetratricopeptide repeat protein [Polaromonas naphthalenivorans]ABM39160.1 Thioredoxin domain protein [Polaromonas naphthalenivorans CJ2]